MLKFQLSQLYWEDLYFFTNLLKTFFQKFNLLKLPIK